MKLKATMRLAHINVRREKSGGEEGDLGTDMKFTGQVHLKDLKAIFHEDHSFAMLEGLYNAEGNLRTLAFGSFVLAASAKGVQATFTTQISKTKVKFLEVEVDKITLVPMISRQMELTFRIKANPSDTQIAQLAEMLKTDVEVDLWSRQAELQFGDARDPDEDEEEDEEEAEGAGA